MGWLTAIGEALKLFNNWFWDPKKKAQDLENEKQNALKKAAEIAHGDDEKALEDYIGKLPK